METKLLTTEFIKKKKWPKAEIKKKIKNVLGLNENENNVLSSDR